MADRRPERLEALRHRLNSLELDAMVVASLPNIRYLTGFSGSAAILLVTAGGLHLFSDFRYREQLRQEVGSLAKLSTETGGAWERLFKALAAEPAVRRVGFESHVLTVQAAARFAAEAAQAWRFAPVENLVEELRTVKSPEEIEAIREAGKVATRSLAAATTTVRAGQTEAEIAAALEAALRREGSEWYPFATIVASGPRSALPHARTSARTVAPGDLLLLDFGAIVDGYCSDVTRTFVVGASPTERQSEVHTAVRNAQAAAIAGLRAGLSGRSADSLAREVIRDAGFAEAFGHSLGHGVGLEVHEGPRLGQTSDDELPAGAVVTVEPGVYLEGWGGVRIEDDVVLRPGGAELLTEFSRDLLRLG
jgi:Xaa-Pro aminopeptidase